MAYHTETFAGVAAQQTYTFLSLGFLSSEHLGVTVNASPVSFTINSARTQLTIVGTPIVGGETIVVTRTTPATEVGRLVNFQDLSHVRQSDLDTSALQLLYIAQETLDVIAGVERLELGVSGHWDGESRRLQNLLPGVASADAMTKGQLDAASIAFGNLPVVSAADNDKSLAVVAGAWAVRTPSQMRTHLGLGTAAVLDVGTAANKVVQLDGSARYPANDGRNIDLANNAVMTALNTRYRDVVGSLRNSVDQTLNNDATGTWSQSGANILTLGALTALDNAAPDVSVAANVVTLSIGTWEIEYIVRLYNANAASNNDQILRLKLTDEVNGGGQVVYDAEFDTVAIRAAGSGNKIIHTASNTLLLKLAAGGKIAVRAVNNGGADIKASAVILICRKVSTSVV